MSMSEELAEAGFQRFWRRLQQLGLNAYESRSYLVLLGHPRFKALELAARAHVPRQKIYEVLDSLVERGFAQVVQEKTKLFSAVEPSLAIPGYLRAKRQALEQELADSGRAGSALDRRSEGPLLGGPGRPRHAGFPAHRHRARADRRRVPPHALRGEAGVRGVFPPALRRGSAGREAGETGAAGRRRRAGCCSKRARSTRAPPAPRRVHGLRHRGPHGGFAAHEAGGLRRPGRNDRAARPGDHAAHLDRRGLPPRRHGRSHDRAVRGPLAERQSL